MRERFNVIAVLLGVVLSCKLARSSAFMLSPLLQPDSLLPPSQYKRTRQSSSALSVARLRDTSIPEIVLPNRTRHSDSNFWHAVVQKDPENVGNFPKLPAVRYLDRDGHLPPAAYRTFGKGQYEPKPSCALSVAVDLGKPIGSDSIDADEIVSGMQKFIDAGLTTFHLGLPQTKRKPIRRGPNNRRLDADEDEDIELLCPSYWQTWGEENVYGKLRKSIPGSIMKSCHLVVPLKTPSARAHSNHVCKAVVREAITESLGRIGTDSVDSLQLEYCEESPYHLEMMDHLVDLQRDGLIKSIVGKSFTPATLRLLNNNGFQFDGHQTDINLMDPNLYNVESRLAASDLDLPIIASNPLAGGLLSDRWEARIFPPLSQEMTNSQHKHMMETLSKWGNTRQSKNTRGLTEFQIWEQYQKKLLPELENIAQYHGVSMASVALRWALQLDHVGSTVVRCNMMKSEEDRQRSLSKRLKQLRHVFSFELSEDDMNRLWEISGMDKTTIQEQEEDEEELRKMMKNRSLWL